MDRTVKALVFKSQGFKYSGKSFILLSSGTKQEKKSILWSYFHVFPFRQVFEFFWMFWMVQNLSQFEPPSTKAFVHIQSCLYLLNQPNYVNVIESLKRWKKLLMLHESFFFTAGRSIAKIGVTLICVSVCPFVCLSLHMSVHPSICLSVC